MKARYYAERGNSNGDAACSAIYAKFLLEGYGGPRNEALALSILDALPLKQAHVPKELEPFYVIKERPPSKLTKFRRPPSDSIH